MVVEIGIYLVVIVAFVLLFVQSARKGLKLYSIHHCLMVFGLVLFIAMPLINYMPGIINVIEPVQIRKGFESELHFITPSDKSYYVLLDGVRYRDYDAFVSLMKKVEFECVLFDSSGNVVVKSSSSSGGSTNSEHYGIIILDFNAKQNESYILKTKINNDLPELADTQISISVNVDPYHNLEIMAKRLHTFVFSIFVFLIGCVGVNQQLKQNNMKLKGNSYVK